jgi:hypothetical protein
MLETMRGILQQGRFGKSGRSGMSLSDGVFWTRRSGGYDIYLSKNGLTDILDGAPIFSCGQALNQTELSGHFLPSDDTWLAIRTVSRFGLESESVAWIQIRTDAEAVGHEVPEPVSNLRGSWHGMGNVRLDWDYSPRAGAVKPKEFHVFSGYGCEPINFTTPIAIVPHEIARRTFTCYTALRGTWYYRCAVRAVTEDGVSDLNQGWIIVRPNTTPPDPAADLTLSM